jgi:hypothetical protein
VAAARAASRTSTRNAAGKALLTIPLDSGHAPRPGAHAVNALCEAHHDCQPSKHEQHCDVFRPTLPSYYLRVRQEDVIRMSEPMYNRALVIGDDINACVPCSSA